MVPISNLQSSSAVKMLLVATSVSEVWVAAQVMVSVSFVPLSETLTTTEVPPSTWHLNWVISLPSFVHLGISIAPPLIRSGDVEAITTANKGNSAVANTRATFPESPHINWLSVLSIAHSPRASTTGPVPLGISKLVAPPKSYTPVPISPLLRIKTSSTLKSSPVKVIFVPAVRLRSSETSRPATSKVPTVAQVAAPKTDRTRINWLVQVAPAYSAKVPFASVKRSADVRSDIAKFVVVALVVVASLTVNLVREVEALETNPLLKR